MCFLIVKHTSCNKNLNLSQLIILFFHVKQSEIVIMVSREVETNKIRKYLTKNLHWF